MHPIRRYRRRLIAGLLLSLVLLAAPAHALESGRFGNVFLETEPVKVRLAARDTRKILLRDSTGKVLAKVRLHASDGNEVDFGLRVPGYYVVNAGSAGRLPVVVVVDPDKRAPGGSRLSTDNGMAWTAKPERYADIAAMLKSIGFSWVRERLSWEQIETSRGHYNWNTNYEQAINALSRQGLKVYEVFHATPPWARADHDRHRAPDDLRDIYRFARNLAVHYRGRVQAWEAWNEPDIAFFGDSASEMAAFQKAAYLGFHAGDVDTQVLNPSMAFGPGPFAEHLLQNGMGPYTDIWNYHLYDETERYAARTESFRALLSRYHLKRPLWITEAGTIAGRTGKASDEGRREQATFLSRALPRALAAGNDRHFWFIFPYLQFSRSDWGVFEPDATTPTPALAALSNATYALGHANYLGALEGLPAGVNAELFDRGNGTQALAVWRETAGTASVDLPLDWSLVRDAVDHLGGPIPRSDGRVKIRISNAAVFLILPAKTLDEQLGKHAPSAAAPATLPAPSPLVVRLRIPEAALDRKLDLYAVSRNGTYKLLVEAYNFSNKPLDVTMVLDGPAAAFLDRKRLSQRLPPQERVQQTLTLRLSKDYDKGGLRLGAYAGKLLATSAVLYLVPKKPD